MYKVFVGINKRYLNKEIVILKIMEKRGRPIGSEIRQNIVEILYFLKEGYAYGIYKIYVDIFPQVTMRSIYYHLKQGVKTGEFKVSKIKKEKGNFSWGDTVEKTYYALGRDASPKISKRVKDYFDKKNGRKSN